MIRNAENGNEREWRIALAVQSVPGFLLVFIMMFMPYSPRWLEDKGRFVESRNTLAKIRSASPNSSAILSEYQSIKDGVEHERLIGSADWSELLKPGIENRLIIYLGIINRLALGIMLQIFQQWTGINFILYYASSLFSNMGIQCFLNQVSIIKLRARS
jgi:SP family sugar:H+ symporter-like MFS transporter